MLFGQPRMFAPVVNTSTESLHRVQVQDKTLEYLRHNAANWGHRAQRMSACGMATLAGEAARIAASWAQMAKNMEQMFNIV